MTFLVCKQILIPCTNCKVAKKQNLKTFKTRMRPNPKNYGLVKFRVWVINLKFGSPSNLEFITEKNENRGAIKKKVK